MMLPGKNIEKLHRKLEARDGLQEAILTLNNYTDHIYLPANGDLSSEDQRYLLHRASSLRWIVGPGEMKVAGHPEAQRALERACLQGGALEFESELFKGLSGELEPRDRKSGPGVDSVFIDMGGSSIKGAFFRGDRVARQDSMAWEPFLFTSMSELVESVRGFLVGLLAGGQNEEVRHVGISSAGLCRQGAILTSALTQGMVFSNKVPYDPYFLKKLIGDLFPQASFELVNDGEVTALPQNNVKSSSKKRVISLVMGSNLGGGYYSDENDERVHEIGFIPFLEDSGLIDSWSGYSGIGSEVFSKKGLLALAKKNGYSVFEEESDRSTIERIHKDLRHGFMKARTVFQEFGRMLAPFIVYLNRYYRIDSVLLSGGILSELAVDEMQEPFRDSYVTLVGQDAPLLRMLVVPGVLPEYNQVWSLALHHFSQQA